MANPSLENNEDDFLSDFDPEKVKSIVRKNWLWLILLPAICVLGAYTALRYIKPVYQSSASLKMEERKVPQFGLAKALQNNPTDDLAGELEIIKSPLIYEEVISTLNLSISYFAEGRILEQEVYKSTPFSVIYEVIDETAYGTRFYVKHLKNNQYELTYELQGNEINYKGFFGKVISTPSFRFVITKNRDFQRDNTPYYFLIYDKLYLMSYLNDNLEVEILNAKAGVIGVSFKDYNLNKAQDIVNTVDSVYTIKTVENKNRENVQKRKYLEQEIERAEQQLDIVEGRLEGFILENKTDNVDKKIGAYFDKFEGLIEQRVAFNNQLRDIIELRAIVNQPKGIEDLTFILPESTPAALNDYITRLNALKLEKEQLALSEYKTTYNFTKKKQQFDFLKRDIDKLLRRSKEQISDDIIDIELKMQKMERDFIGLPSKATELSKIKKNYEFIENYYFELAKQKIQLGLAAAGVVPGFEVLAPASLPREPISPNKLGIYAGATGLGIFLSLSLIVLQYLLHNKISNQRELERLVSLPILGAVPKYAQAKMDFSKLVVHNKPKSFISEAFRSIRTNLDFMLSHGQVGQAGKKVISITSTISGEGKTFVATNLGGIIAMSNLKVVIVDLDMRKPKLHMAFDAGNVKGTSTILIGRHSYQECIQSSTVENLDYITAGPIPPNPSELILREEFNALIDTLQTLYDIVILDTPPVGLVTDGVLIMQSTTLRIFVLRAEYSKKEFAKNIAKLVRSNELQNVGLVLNATEGRNKYGGYRYGYGGYYEETSQQPWWQRLTKRFKK